MPVHKFDTITVSYEPKHLDRIVGMAVDGVSKFGKYFPVYIRHRHFELELLYISWDDESQEIHPRVIRGGENIQTLHGRLRLSISKVEKGRYKGKYLISLRRALLKDEGVTLHSNLFQASLSDLDESSGFDTYVTLKNFGALEIGKKEDIINDKSPRRNDFCCVFAGSKHDVAIAAFIITRLFPVKNNYYI